MSQADSHDNVTMQYPKLEAVDSADAKLIELWYNELPPPGANYTEFPQKEFRKKLREETRILTRITERYVELYKAKAKLSLLERAKEARAEAELEELNEE